MFKSREAECCMFRSYRLLDSDSVVAGTSVEREEAGGAVAGIVCSSSVIRAIDLSQSNEEPFRAMRE